MTEKKFIIGLAGPIWDGFSRQVALQYLKSQGFHITSPLSVIKEAAKKFYGWDGNLDSSGKAVVERMCIAGRSISMSYWLSLALMRVPKDAKRLVINDMFFDDELNFVSKSEGLILFFPSDKDPEPTHWEDMSVKYDWETVPQGTSASYQESLLKSSIARFCD